MIETILGFPAILKLGLVLAVAVVLMRTSLPMAVGLLTGACYLAVLFAMPVGDFFRAVLHGMKDDQTIFLIVIVIAILLFSSALNETGQIGRIVDAFRRLVGRSRVTLVTYPALIGLLPMPGGAVFSAPMVRAAVDDPNVSPDRLSIANYWFRHIWEYWFPLYPGVILALTLTGASAWKFALLQMPLTVWSLAAGYVVILHGLKLGGTAHAREISGRNALDFVRELTPILLVVVTVLGLNPVSEKVAEWWAPGNLAVRQSGVLVALALGLAWLFVFRGLTVRRALRQLFSAQVWKMVFMMLSIMIFRAVLERSGGVDTLNRELSAAGISMVFVVAFLPFIAGMLAGVAFGFVGTSFPFILPLIATLPEEARLPYYTLAFSMGYCGMMLSPLHLCLLLTNEYFEANILKVYRYLFPLGVGTMLVATGLFLLYTRVF